MRKIKKLLNQYYKLKINNIKTNLTYEKIEKPQIKKSSSEVGFYKLAYVVIIFILGILFISSIYFPRNQLVVEKFAEFVEKYEIDKRIIEGIENARESFSEYIKKQYIEKNSNLNFKRTEKNICLISSIKISIKYKN